MRATFLSLWDPSNSYVVPLELIHPRVPSASESFFPHLLLLFGGFLHFNLKFTDSVLSYLLCCWGLPVRFSYHLPNYSVLSFLLIFSFLLSYTCILLAVCSNISLNSSNTFNTFFLEPLWDRSYSWLLLTEFSRIPSSVIKHDGV